MAPRRRQCYRTAMRKFGVLGLALLAAFVAALIWHLPDRLERLTEPVVSELPPPASPLSASPSSASPPPASSPPVAEPAAAAPPAPAPQLPALPTREVAQIPFHAVPENEEPAKPQPVEMRDAPGLATSRHSSRGNSRSAALPPPPRQLAGKAEATGAAALAVAGHNLRLFGVRPPESNDNCRGSGGTAVRCTERAQAVLAGRLARNTSCRFPAPSSNDAAICLDGDGVDLGGLLVAEGLALADRSQSFDYVGAESIAQSQKRGLWQYRR